MLKMVLGSLQICIMRFTKDYMKTLKKLLEKNPAFKIQTVCQYSYEYNTIRDCGDNDYYHDVNPSTSAFATSKSVESSLISIDDTLQSQKMEVQKRIEDKADSASISRVEKIITVVYQTIKVEVRHIFQHHRHIIIQDAD